MNLTVKIRRITPAKISTIRAFVDYELFADGEPVVAVLGAKVVQQDGQKPWVAVPSSQYTKKNGEKAYQNHVEIPERHRGLVTKAVLEAWNDGSPQTGGDAPKAGSASGTAAVETDEPPF